MTLPGKKINELTPSVASVAQLIPVGYSNSPDTNSITVQQIIDLVPPPPTPPTGGFIKEWDNTTIYEVGDVVYYSSSTTKGIFEITDRTIAGETPESSAYTKFKSVSLSFIPNPVATGGDSFYFRTLRLAIPSVTFSGNPDARVFVFQTSFDTSYLNNARIIASLARDGLTGSVTLRIANSNNSGGFVTMYLEFWGSGTLTDLYVDFKIEL